MKKITIEDAILEIKRELKVREQVYPRLIQGGQLHRYQANKHYLALKFALELLEEKEQQKTGVQAKLF